MAGIQHAAIDPMSGERIGSGILENKYVPVLVIIVRTIRRRVIQIPFAVDAVEFGRPD
jgi:hypothetical protein